MVSSRHMIRNSNLGGLRPSSLLLGHFTGEQGRHILFSWNWNARAGKSDFIKDVTDVIESNDITALYETWDVNCDVVKTLCGGNSCETLNAKKLSRYGLPSGGVAVYISNTMLPGVRRICDDFSLGIVFTLDGTYFMSKNYICKVYLCSTKWLEMIQWWNKRYWNIEKYTKVWHKNNVFQSYVLHCLHDFAHKQDSQLNSLVLFTVWRVVIEVWQDSLLDSSAFSHCSVWRVATGKGVLITGDMNARVGKELDYIIDDNVKYLRNVHWYDVSNFSTVRKFLDARF